MTRVLGVLSAPPVISAQPSLAASILPERVMFRLRVLTFFGRNGLAKQTQTCLAESIFRISRRQLQVKS